METLEFLRLVTPSRGHYFAAVPADSGRGFRHHLCETHAELTAKCLSLDEQGATVYFALGSFKEPRIQRTKGEDTFWVERVQENVQSLRAFWLDLDVGISEEGRPPKYESQSAAVISLGEMLSECGLPKPLLVSSGYGIHAYWPLTADVMVPQWKQTATDLKTLCAGMKLLTDPMRTADCASVLRPVGTHNRKVKDGVPSALPVIAVNSIEPVDYLDFHKRVNAAMKAHNITPKVMTAAKVNAKLNEGLSITRTYAPAHAEIIAEKCNQIKMMKDSGGDISEPHWYAAIQLLNKTIDGESVIHAWSKGYTGYSREETDAKIRQVSEMGPTLCSTFESRNPDGCVNCKFAGHINTPIQLGIKFVEAPAPKVIISTDEGDKEVDLPPPPPPFKRGSADQPGLYAELEGVPIQFYPYDLFPTGLEYDEADRYETTRIRHWLPMEGWKEFKIQSSLIHSPREFNTALADQSVKYSPEGKLKDTMRIYMSSYLQRIQQSQRVNVHHMKMGWKEGNTQFLLGPKLFMNDGTVRKAGISAKTADALTNFGTKGDFDKWKALTRKLDEPGYEPHAFGVMIGFGAPLVEIVGMDGLMVNMVGPTGGGKSATGRLMSSIYGRSTKSSNSSTVNARIEKMGAYGNLPIYIDEISNIEPKELSQLAYDIANGIGKDRLRADSSIKEAVKWCTMALTSSNHNLHEKLQMAKGDPEAEKMRLFEYDFPEIPGYFEYAENVLHPTLDENYGHAGEAYIHALVQMDKKQIKADIKAMKDSLVANCGGKGGERFWMFGAACAIYGACLAKSLGLIEFNPIRVLPWIYSTILGMRGAVAEAKNDEVTMLASFIDETQRERIVVYKGLVEGAISMDHAVGSSAKLSQRLEKDTARLYINRQTIKEWCGTKGYEYRIMRDKLRQRKILLPDDKLVTLGKGTNYAGFQLWCWVIDLRHSESEAFLRKEGALDVNTGIK